MQILRPALQSDRSHRAVVPVRALGVEWTGETIFLDGAGQIAQAVLSRPDPLGVMDGPIRHAGPPSRLCHAPRYTMAIKCERLAAGVAQAGWAVRRSS